MADDLKDIRDVPQAPKRSKNPRYGMGYDYYDYYCPTCAGFIAYEPVGLRFIERGIETRCQHCGQKIAWKKKGE